MTDKEKELLNKLKALADKGIAGEKATAEKKLKQLMKKLEITEKDLEKNKEELYIFKIKKGLGKYGKDFLIQIIAYVYKEKMNDLRGTVQSECIKLYITADKYLEISALYDFYFEKLKEKFNLMYSAFIDANDLYSGVSDKTPTKKELDRLLKIKAISGSIEKDEFYKRLENNG